MNKLLILGAGVYQVPLIKKAHEMGLYTIVVSIPGNYPGFEYADKVYYENITDTQAVLKIASEEQIDGIVTCGSDVAIVTLATVCERLGLKGVSVDSAEKSCNKVLMKKALKDADVKCADYRVALISDSFDDILKKCIEIGYPVVIKAVDSSGSRGITIVREESELEHAISQVKNVTRKEEFLIEECLSGTEFGADAFVYNGETQFVVPHGKFVYMAATGIPVGHYVPYDDERVSELTIGEVEKAIEAMGYDNCAVNVDIMLQNGEPYVIEIGARAGATCIPELISIYNGYDYYQKLIEASLGMDTDMIRKADASKAGVARLLFSEKTGMIDSIRDDITISDMSEGCGVYAYDIDVKPQDKVKAMKIGPDRFGHLVVFADDLDTAMKKLTEELDKIEIVLKE